MFLNQLDHEKAQKAPLFLDLAILLLASQKSDEAISKETSEMKSRENYLIDPFLNNFNEQDVVKTKNISFNTFRNKTGFQFREKEITINFGNNEYIKTQTWSKIKETASKVITQNGQKKEIKEIVINKLISEGEDILKTTPEKMKELILEIPSVQEDSDRHGT